MDRIFIISILRDSIPEDSVASWNPKFVIK